MEIPLYFSFKKFSDNYDNDLKNWSKIYSESDEFDFLNELAKIYGKFNSIFFHIVYDTPFIVLSDKENYFEFDDVTLIRAFNYLYDFNFFNEVEYPIDILNLNEVNFHNFRYSIDKINQFINSKSKEIENLSNENFENVNKNPTKIPKVKSRLNQKQVSILGRLIYEEMYQYEVRPTQKDIANSLSQIFGFSPNSILNDMTGQNYLDNFEKQDKQRLEEVLSEVISKL